MKIEFGWGRGYSGGRDSTKNRNNFHKKQGWTNKIAAEQILFFNCQVIAIHVCESLYKIK